jgi:NADH-quinone oxidoreductase subunit N
MVFAGFGYKISAAPFHMWTPDVYEGSPLPITAFFSVVPKTAGIVALGRFLFTAFSQVDSGTAQLSFVQNIHWNYVLSAVAVITMFVGNLAALQQSNMKRLLAYSSISHAGFLLLGLSAMDRVGFASTLFYAVIYYFMNLGAFWIALEVMELTGSESVDAFKGLAGREPVLAVLMMVFLFSLTGLPPFAGFVSKWYVFAAVIQKGMVGAAVAAVLNTVIALFYYARIVRLMFFDKPLAEFAVKGNVATLTVTVVGALAAPTLILGLYWEPVYRVVKASTVLLGLPQ